MTNYKVKNLSAKTPEAQLNKLQANLKAIAGVDTVTMHAAKSEVSLAFGGTQHPKREIIATAVSKSGFTLEVQP